jgi:hypothetical protein
VEGFDVIDYPEGLPCWAPGAADYLASLLTGKENAWEWGGGQSTVWLQDKVRHIEVIETDPKWGKWIKNRTSLGKVVVRLIDMNDPSYLEPFLYMARMLWLIDGFRRIDCLAVVEQHAEEGNIVVLDDALDYAEHLLDKVEFGRIKRFAQPHPHAGIPINHKKYGWMRNTVRKVHADTKETWVWTV